MLAGFDCLDKLVEESEVRRVVVGVAIVDKLAKALDVL